MRLSACAGVLIGSLVLCGLIYAGCVRRIEALKPAARETATGVAGSFAGRVDGSQAFIGIVTTEDRSTVAFVSDGDSLAIWFEGNTEGNRVDITFRGANLTATLSIEGATGVVTLANGRSLPFRAPPAGGEAGLYRAKRTLAGQDYIGGWIVLPDGEQRGTVLAGGKSYPPGTFVPSRPVVQLPVGTLEARRLNP